MGFVYNRMNRSASACISGACDSETAMERNPDSTVSATVFDFRQEENPMTRRIMSHGRSLSVPFAGASASDGQPVACIKKQNHAEHGRIAGPCGIRTKPASTATPNSSIIAAAV